MSSCSNPSSPNVSSSETGSPTNYQMSPVRQMKINEAKFSHETYKGLVKSKAHRDPVYLMEAQRLHRQQQDRYDLTALAGLKRNKFSDFHLEDEEAFEADKINMERVKQSSKKRKL